MTLRDRIRPVAHGLRSALGTNGLADRLAAIETRLGRAEAAVEARAIPAPPPVAPAPVPAAPPPLDINLLMHHSRGAYLRAMPPGARRLLSAGCAGRWYFDWIEQCYGRVPEHIGIEYYAPPPADLPDNVTWIANTASDMSDVADASCDLVFSGQNLEHLWPEEVAGFLAESARVLRPGGHLVVDSPNRTQTAPLNWSHPEHTVELTVPEIAELLELAGFEVTKTVGIWLCRDPRTGRVLPFDPNVADADWSVTERLIAAHDRPEDAMLWWLEARRTADAPRTAEIGRRMDEIFAAAWPERVQRLIVPGHATEARADGEWVLCPPGHGGTVFYGPYMPLRAGRYRCSFRLDPDPAADAPYAVCEAVAGTEARVLARCEVGPGQREAVLDFALDALQFGMQFRCAGLGRAGFSVLRRIELEEAPA